MTLAALPYVYCDKGDAERYLSAQGVQDRLDDDSDGLLLTAEAAAVDDAVNEATETINFYCFDKYAPEMLAMSHWINRIATILMSYRLCSRRGNTPPQIVQEDAERAEGYLKSIHDNSMKVPGLPLRRVLAPTWSHTRVVVWPYSFRCIRVERLNSSQHAKTSLPQNVDYQEQYSYDPK